MFKIKYIFRLFSKRWGVFFVDKNNLPAQGQKIVAGDLIGTFTYAPVIINGVEYSFHTHVGAAMHDNKPDGEFYSRSPMEHFKLQNILERQRTHKKITDNWNGLNAMHFLDTQILSMIEDAAQSKKKVEVSPEELRKSLS